MQLSVRIAEELILPTLRAIENDLIRAQLTQQNLGFMPNCATLIEEMTVERSTELEQPPEQSTSEQPGLALCLSWAKGTKLWESYRPLVGC